MKLNIDTWKVIDENEFSKLVGETYGRPYQLQQQDPMMGQDEIRHITVSREDSGDYYDGTVTLKDWLSRDPSELPPNEQPAQYGDPEVNKNMDSMKIELWWQRDFYPPLEVITTDLCRKGLLEPGDYTIHAGW